MEKVRSIDVFSYFSFKGFERQFLKEGYTKVYTASLARKGYDFDYLVEFEFELGKINGNSNINQLCNRKINLIRISEYDSYYYGAYFLIKTI